MLASTLPSAFKNCEEVPPDLMIELPEIVPVAVIEPVAETEVGVIAPKVKVMVGVVVGLNTDPLTPLAVVTDTVVTVPVPVTGIAHVLSPLKNVVEEGVPEADRLAIPTIEFPRVPLKVPPVMVPLTFKLDKVPTAVMLFMALVLSVPLIVVASTVPVTVIP